MGKRDFSWAPSIYKVFRLSRDLHFLRERCHFTAPSADCTALVTSACTVKRTRALLLFFYENIRLPLWHCARPSYTDIAAIRFCKNEDPTSIVLLPEPSIFRAPSIWHTILHKCAAMTRTLLTETAVSLCKCVWECYPLTGYDTTLNCRSVALYCPRVRLQFIISLSRWERSSDGIEAQKVLAWLLVGWMSSLCKGFLCLFGCRLNG